MDGFDQLDLDSLRDASDVCLEDALIFKWDIPRNVDTQDLDFAHGSHSGVELLTVDEEETRSDSSGVTTPQSDQGDCLEVVSLSEELAGLHGQQRETVRVLLERSAKAGQIVLVP